MAIDSVSNALTRLGGTEPLELSPDEMFVVLRRDANGWRSDERVALRDLERGPSAAVLAVFALAWPRGTVRRKGEELQLIRASEQYDFRDGMTWITARVFAHSINLQTYYALNLREEAKDPARLSVYAVDDDGSDVRVEAPLGAFLRSLAPIRGKAR